MILAAGQGKRMRSRRPKALHRVGGLSLIEHSLRAALEATGRPPVAVLSPAQVDLLEALQDRAEVVFQERALGTGDALLRARPALLDEAAALVLPADMPLLSAASLGRLLSALRASTAGASVLTARVERAAGYGRVRRAPGGALEAIVEDADEPWDGQPAEVNCGAYAFALPRLWEVLERLGSENAQGERYLSWAPQMLGPGVALVELEEAEEALQVNDRLELAAAEAAMRRRTLRRLMLGGVTVADPEATWVDCEVEVGEDTWIGEGSVIRGRSRIGRDCVVGPFAELRDVELGDGCRVGRSQLTGCKLAQGVDVGPFNRVRPGSELDSESHLGTFTEVVRSRVGPGSQVPHLSYVGDAELGPDVNVGAGSITANWDGLEKNRTVVEGGARLGSNTVLVAPVRVGERAYTGAGSVITEDVPPGALGIARPAQQNIEGWTERRRAGARPAKEAGSE